MPPSRAVQGQPVGVAARAALAAMFGQTPAGTGVARRRDPVGILRAVRTRRSAARARIRIVEARAGPDAPRTVQLQLSLAHTRRRRQSPWKTIGPPTPSAFRSPRPVLRFRVTAATRVGPIGVGSPPGMARARDGRAPSAVRLQRGRFRKAVAGTVAAAARGRSGDRSRLAVAVVAGGAEGRTGGEVGVAPARIAGGGLPRVLPSAVRELGVGGVVVGARVARGGRRAAAPGVASVTAVGTVPAALAQAGSTLE